MGKLNVWNIIADYKKHCLMIDLLLAQLKGETYRKVQKCFT